MDKIKYLSRIHLFDELGMEQLQRLEPMTPAQSVNRKTIVASPAASRQRLFLVKSGKVRLYRLLKSGKDITVDLLGEGHVFGDAGWLANGSEGLYAEALEDSVICSIGQNQLEAMIHSNPELGMKLVGIMASRLKEMEEMLEYIAYGSVRKRLLYLLGKLSQKFGEETGGGEGWVRLNVQLTHQELASMAGSIRETVTEQLNRFASEGLIDKGSLRPPVRVHPERLSAAIESCD